MRTLGRSIREAREVAGLDQTQLAEKIGKSQRTVSAYERDEVDLPVSVLRAIARATNTTPAVLLGEPPRGGIEELMQELGYDIEDTHGLVVGYLLKPNQQE